MDERERERAVRESQEAVRQDKVSVPEETLRQCVLAIQPDFDYALARAVMRPGLSLIACLPAESAGASIREDAEDLEDAGADAVCVVTGPARAQMAPAKEAAEALSVPCLLRTVVTDAYQIYEAKLLGVHALTIDAGFPGGQDLADLLMTCDMLGISAVVTVHDAEELERALTCGASIVAADEGCAQLRRMCPPDVLTVSLGEVRTREDVRILEQAGVDAAMLGRAFREAPNRTRMMRDLRGGKSARGRGGTE